MCENIMQREIERNVSCGPTFMGTAVPRKAFLMFFYGVYLADLITDAGSNSW